MVQSRQDIEAAVELVDRAIEMDDKCDFAYETLATLEVQRWGQETSFLATLQTKIRTYLRHTSDHGWCCSANLE